MHPSLATGCKYTLVILAAYAAVLCIGPYGFNDDYQYLYRVHAGTFDPAHNEQVGMGRPAASWLLECSFALCGGSVAHLVYLRLAGLAGVLLYALVLHRGLARSGYDERFVVAVVLLTTLSPAFGVYAAWASCFLSPCALTLCVVAGILLEEPPGVRWPRWPRVTGAFSLILLACGIWQAAVPMALFIGFARAWNGPMDNAAVRRMCKPWFIIGSSALVYLVAQRLAIRTGWVSSAGAERMALTTDVSSKFQLLHEILRAGFSSWGRFHPGALEWLVAGATLLGVGVSVSAQYRSPLVSIRRAALAALMILSSISPLLVAGENNAAYRTLPVLYATVAFLAVDGFRRLLLPWSVRWRTRAGYALFAALVICAHIHVRYGIVEPNTREYTGVRQQVRRQFGQMPTHLVYLLPPPTLFGEGKLQASWEYGLISSSFWWVTKPFLLLVFHDLGMTPAERAATLEISYREAENKDVPVLHPLPAILRDGGRWRDDPLWGGRVQEFPGGWLYCPWLGYLNIKAWPIVQHHLFGPLLFLGGKNKALWFHREGLGDFFAARETFPSLYLSAPKTWVYATDADAAHCAVRNANGTLTLLNKPTHADPPTDAAPPAANVHPAFFNGEVALSNGVYYLKFGDREFGYYSYQDFPYLHHFDLGYLYFSDAHDTTGGCYLYDFQGLGWFYTNPRLYPYLYNVEHKAFYYYFRGTKNPRSFVNMDTKEFINK